ncbi:hypothetical protein EJ02DRAFT_507934 [Clathrospora elynae]|uniref:Uncharacterized protein n=1 Tax=Clathrospora elynae TaxID=706981 RepID=A0A6A5T4H6_9PLEO|nr:hypothetical protein EJ02DRAFT_507934 [Clathrospora elynae]
MATLAEIRCQTFVRRTILSGWRRTGLAPFNPEVVLSQLKQQEDCSEDERSPTPPLVAVLRTTTPEILSSPPMLTSSPTRAPIRQYHHVKIDLEQAALVRQALPQNSNTPEPENPAPGDAGWHTPKTIRQVQMQETVVRSVLHKHLPCKIAAGVIKHQRGVSALARIAEGLKQELRHTEAAKIAKNERRNRKRRALEVKGGPVYSQDARKMVQQRQINDVARLENELATKTLREATRTANKLKQLLPTIRNQGSKYCKRAAADILIQRNVAQWIYAHNDHNYNTKIATKLEYIQHSSSFKYRKNSTTTDLTPACKVAGQVRCRVDPYTQKFGDPQIQQLQLQRTTQDNDDIPMEEIIPSAHQLRSSSFKIESQLVPAGSEEESSDGSSTDNEADSSSPTGQNELENDWGMQ